MLPEKRLCNQELSHISATPLLNLVCCQILTSWCLQADRGRGGLPPSSAARQSDPRRRKRTWRQSSTRITPIRWVTQTNARSSCRLRPDTASLPVHSDLRATWEGFLRRRVSHSSASGSRCRGHVEGAQIVTANLSVWVGVFSVPAFSMWGCLSLSKAFLSTLRLYE